MPGRGSEPGEQRYPECGSGRGVYRHRTDRTRTCAACRAFQAQRQARERKARILGQPLRVPALGTQRRIRALARMGWSQRSIGARLGVPGGRVGKWLAQQELSRDTAQRVAVLYRDLMLTAGPDDRERRRAERLGWPGPLDWDDIDRDPDVVARIVVERDHGEARVAYRAHLKLLARRRKRAEMSAGERCAARSRRRARAA
jgi:hypothetical protein